MRGGKDKEVQREARERGMEEEGEDQEDEEKGDLQASTNTSLLQKGSTAICNTNFLPQKIKK